MPSTIIRSAQAATGATNRQDLRGFATTASPASTDPIAQSAVACDTQGLPLMGRTLHDAANDIEVGDGAVVALPAYAERARLMLQNLSESDVLWFDFGSTAVAGACFKCFAGQMFVFDGDACPADALSVVADTGLVVPFYAKDW